jgi:hypothetical protein
MIHFVYRFEDVIRDAQTDRQTDKWVKSSKKFNRYLQMEVTKGSVSFIFLLVEQLLSYS